LLRDPLQLREARRSMMLRAGSIHESARILVPVAQELLKPTCPRYFRTELEEADLSLPGSIIEEDDEFRYFNSSRDVWFYAMRQVLIIDINSTEWLSSVTEGLKAWG
jgi:hypothetical protein